MSFHGGSPCNARSVAQSLGRMALLFGPSGPRHQDSTRSLMKPGDYTKNRLPRLLVKWRFCDSNRRRMGKQLLRNPNDESQFVILVVRRNLPASGRRKVNASHQK